MDNLTACLANLTERPLGTVVHIGAGRSAVLQDYANIAAQSVVLVEGDPQIGADLLKSAAPYENVRVVTRVVASDRSNILWHRYNLSALNGPLQADALKADYPKMRETERMTIEAVSLGDVLDDVVVAPDDRFVNVLVLDMPGQEFALLESIDRRRLSGYGAVLVRGCQEPNYGAGATLDRTIAVLREHSFELAVRDSEAQPLWPVALMTVDAGSASRNRLKAELDAALDDAAAWRRIAAERLAQLDAVQSTATDNAVFAQSQREDLIHRIEVLENSERAEIAQAHERCTQLEASLEKSQEAYLEAQREHAGRIDPVVRERDALAASLNEHEILVGELQAAALERNMAIASLSRTLDEMRIDRENGLNTAAAMAQESTNQAELAAARLSQIDMLESRLSLAAEERADIDAQLSSARSDLQVESDRASKRRSELEALRAQLADMELKVATLANERDELAEKARSTDELGNQVTSLERLLVQAKAALQQATDQASSESAKSAHELAKVSKDRDEQQHWHHENAKWAQNLKAENERIKFELSAMNQSKEALVLKIEKSTEANSAMAAQLTERDARQRLLDVEILKAEAQLDLIKDVLIREKNF